MDKFCEIDFLILSVVSTVFCLDTIILEFKREDVFSNTIFSIVCWSFGNQSRWSLLIEQTILAKLFFRIFVASNLWNKPASIRFILFGYWAALWKKHAVKISKNVIGLLSFIFSTSSKREASSSSFNCWLLKTNLSLIFWIWGLV